MMKVGRFEDLNIYKDARLLTKRIYDTTKMQGFIRDFSLANQMKRAASSVMLNIAEGFERKGDKEFAQFLFVAKGSCGEIRAQLDIAFDQSYMEKEVYSSIRADCEKLSRMISSLIKYLKKTRV
ncbi:MAG: four helix bundle protein [Candidatus Firestonebacteria bacterium]